MRLALSSGLMLEKEIIRGLESSEYEHPLDFAYLNKVKDLPGTKTIAKKVLASSLEPYYQISYTGSYIRASKEAFPQIEETMKALNAIKTTSFGGVARAEGAIGESKILIRLKARRAAEKIEREKQEKEREASSLAAMGWTPKEPSAKIPEVPIVPPKVDVNTIIKNIEIKLPDDILDRLMEETGATIIEKMKTDEKLQKFLAKVIRPYV